MKTVFRRRDFVSKCLKACAAGCTLLYSNPLLAQDVIKLQKKDLKNLTYCCYRCSTECPTYKASIENNVEAKRKAYEDAKWKEKYGVDFDPDKFFCYGCKPEDKPLGINVKACTVRSCVIEKGFDCCIECTGLAACDKQLWKNYPDFKSKVLEAQKVYQKG